jgi:large subunit ribosomal protein L25
MKTVSLSGSPRVSVGKKDAAQLRRDGNVPCVLYGGENQTHFQVNEIAMAKLVNTPDVFQFELEIDGTTVKAIVQDIQFHPLTDRVVHVDFLQLFDDKMLKIAMPVRLTGSAIGVRNGGRLMQNFRRLKLIGLPGEIPEAIEIDIAKLRIGHSIRVSELSFGGIKFLDPASAVVVGVKTARNVVEDEEEEEEGEEGAEGEGGDAPAEGGDAPAAE